MRFPAADLFGILALESHRAGALVIGEDLGTVPRGLPAVLARWGVLSTRVLYFERSARGAFRPARAYPARALVAANTHDLTPLAGFWAGADLRLRRRLGLLGDARALGRARATRARERRALLRRLRREGVLAAGSAPATSAALGAAVHAFLARTPAVLIGVSLDDLTGEEAPVNQPGVSIARYPSWSRRMRLPLESVPTDPGVARALNGLPSGPRRAKTRSR
jgi:4-alpha-glucanotransferase